MVPPAPMTSLVYIMTSRSGCGLLHFASYVEFQSEDIHVLDSFSRSYFSVTFFILTVLFTLLGTEYFVVVSRRCMIQPFIFLMLIVVSLS
jgi:hypothetical protein